MPGGQFCYKNVRKNKKKHTQQTGILPNGAFYQCMQEKTISFSDKEEINTCSLTIYNITTFESC
jgi:hypothetical protein